MNMNVSILFFDRVLGLHEWPYFSSVSLFFMTFSVSLLRLSCIADLHVVLSLTGPL